MVIGLLGDSSIVLTANTDSDAILRFTRNAAEQMDGVLWCGG